MAQQQASAEQDQSNSIWQLLGINLTGFTLYLLLGWVSLRLSPADTVATSIFLPAGIALGWVLIYGLRSLVGVGLGAQLVGLMVIEHPGANPALLLWPLLILPTAVLVQAALGRYLAQRLVNWPDPLDSPRNISAFILLVIPLSCLVQASVSLPWLWWFGGLEFGPQLTTWLSWWLADVLGATVIVPVLLVFLARPRNVWRPRRVVLVLPLLLLTGLGLLLFRQLDLLSVERFAADFERDTEALSQQLERRLDAHMETLLALERLVQLNPDLSRDQFRDFVGPFLDRHSASQNFSFNPRVRDAQRAEFEAEVQRAGFGEFQILDRLDGATTGRAATRTEYFPILYVEPLAENRSVIGLDPQSIDSPQVAIKQTMESGEPKASAPFTLTQEPGDQIGMVIYSAVKDRSGSGEEAVILGLVTAAFRLGDLMEDAIAAAPTMELQVCLVDLGGRAGSQRLAGTQDCERPDWLAARHVGLRELGFAGREWQLRVQPGAGTAVVHTWPAWIPTLIGFVLTGSLAAFLLLVTGQSRRVSELVQRRTRELAEASEELLEQQQALDRAQQVAALGSWEWIPGEEGSFNASRGLAELLGLPLESLDSPDALIRAIHPDDQPRLASLLGRAELEAEPLSMDCRLGRQSERVLHMALESDWAEVRPWRVRAIAQDVTDARKAAERIEYLAHYDELTGLPNRRLWFTCAERALQSAKRHGYKMAVMFLDLDEFKTINDSLGHGVGDELLKQVGRRLGEAVRDEDTLARLGGDEFVILLPRLEESSSAAPVAEKLLKEMAEPFELEDRRFKLGASIGITIYPDDGDDVDTLLQHADTAMYRAKSAGRDNYKHFAPEMNDEARARLDMENAIRRGLEQDEFMLHFQPQVNSRDKSIVGFEALLRWHHPELGMVPPGEFIPAAERSGLILPLGDRVLWMACRQQKAWSDSGDPVLSRAGICVNVSPIQFRRLSFVDHLKKIIQATGVDPALLTLEITESSLMDMDSQVLEGLHRLRELGIKLALDDFGTGYSSLSYLKQLPITLIKLDRSFVMDLPDDEEDAAIAETAIAMAAKLGMTVIAEGVETGEQRRFLENLGCCFMQGFLFARPMSPDDLADWVKSPLED